MSHNIIKCRKQVKKDRKKFNNRKLFTSENSSSEETGSSESEDSSSTNTEDSENENAYRWLLVGEVVRLSDLFENDRQALEARVVDSPIPGGRLMYQCRRANYRRMLQNNRRMMSQRHQEGNHGNRDNRRTRDTRESRNDEDDNES